ncbi:MAG: polysaccharide deacetylase family protein, partial [Oscillospiraceae bacterium]
FMENTEKYNIKFMIFEDMTNIMPMFDVRCIPSVKPVVNQVFYPGYLKKAVTFSYDDGPKEDKKLIELMDKNGVKGTFNLNSDKYFTYDTTAVLPSDRYDKNKVELGDNVSLQDEVKTRYQGHEVANHVKWHPHMYTDQALPAGFPNLTDAECIRYINEGKADLEKIFNKPITGMAWPYHAPNRPVVMESLKQQAVKYARSIESTSTFDMPSDWLYWKPTAHHTAAYGLWDSFETLTDDGKLKLFSVWGHAYEFSADSSANPPRVDTWNQIDEFLTKVGNNVSVWKATNIDVCNYVKALDSVKIVGDTIYNSSNMDLYMEVSGKRIVLKANGSYKVI